MSNLMTSDIINPNCVSVVWITRFTPNHDILSNSSLSIVVSDTDNAGVEDTIELAILVGFIVVVVLSKVDTTTNIVVNASLLRSGPRVSLVL